MILQNWDFYGSGRTWENGTPIYSRNAPGIAGSGVHAAITCHYEGLLTYSVVGMKRDLAGGRRPEEQPIYEPICSSWVAASGFPNNPSSDWLLVLLDLPAEAYRLVSYHNRFNCRRVGDDPTGVECDEVKEPEPPMRSTKVFSMKTIVSNYFGHHVETFVKGKTYGTSQAKIILAQQPEAGNVRQIKEARNVVIQ